MRLPKRYGESQERKCPFCGKLAMAISVQKVPVCKNHVDAKIPEIKCACGSWLEMREGKWGPFFLCMRCGVVSFKKAVEMLSFMKPKEAIQITTGKTTIADTTKRNVATPTQKPAPRAVPRQAANMVVRSDDPRFFD